VRVEIGFNIDGGSVGEERYVVVVGLWRW